MASSLALVFKYQYCTSVRDGEGVGRLRCTPVLVVLVEMVAVVVVAIALTTMHRWVAAIGFAGGTVAAVAVAPERAEEQQQQQHKAPPILFGQQGYMCCFELRLLDSAF